MKLSLGRGLLFAVCIAVFVGCGSACAPVPVGVLRGAGVRPAPACIQERVDAWMLQWLKGVQKAAAAGGRPSLLINTATMADTLGSEPDVLDNNNPALLGDATDDFGCLTSAGYTWCHSSQACTPVWEECLDMIVVEIDDSILSSTATPVPERRSTEELFGDNEDEHGCLTSAGYVWCDNLNACSRVWEDCPSTDQGTIVSVAVRPGTDNYQDMRPTPRNLRAKPTDQYKDAEFLPGQSRAPARKLGSKPTEQYKDVPRGINRDQSFRTDSAMKRSLQSKTAGDQYKATRPRILRMDALDSDQYKQPPTSKYVRGSKVY
eukprot:INCI4896.1.p1 GENE.INCI4896.1~~INCI4896.1.p1  ORF type:complete len:319 (+),score=40.55 INCI4896.1:133-1089(+)